MKHPKVFCIGMHKTGTTTMGKALQHLGYKVKSSIPLDDPRIKTINAQLKTQLPLLLSRFDAFEDHPWPFLCEKIDRLCPGSKFILTTRHTESWWASVEQFFGTKQTLMRQWVYGVGHGAPAGNKKAYVTRFEGHNAAVRHYFKSRPSDLLTIDLSDGNNWEKICGFLKTDIPSVEFPHAHKSANYDKHQRLANA